MIYITLENDNRKREETGIKEIENPNVNVQIFPNTLNNKKYMSSSSHNSELETYGYTIKKPAACMKNTVNILKAYEKKKIPSWEICRKTCITNEKCEYFKFEVLLYRVSHITVSTLFLLFSWVLEDIQRNFS